MVDRIVNRASARLLGFVLDRGPLGPFLFFEEPARVLSNRGKGAGKCPRLLRVGVKDADHQRGRERQSVTGTGGNCPLAVSL